MNIREKTLKIKVSDIVSIGHSNEVLIQSMCNTKTSNINEIVSQINRCQKLGAQLMRVSVLDEEDAKAISSIKKEISIPIIADIHFDYKLAIMSIENGADKIRINPGNIGSISHIEEIIDVAKRFNVCIRIGVNSGSMDKEIYSYDSKLTAKTMIESLKKHIKIFEDKGFYNLVLSIKSTDVLETIEANILASKEFKYPLHIGLTEAGIKDLAIIRSCAALAPLLVNGIGNTIRISITGNPEEEVIAAKRLLHDLGLYSNYPTLISCPTCGRTKVDVEKIANKVLNFLETVNKKITVAIMGCVVNGPGEAKNADIGLAGGTNCFVLFKKGKIIKKINEKEAYDALINEILNF